MIRKQVTRDEMYNFLVDKFNQKEDITIVGADLENYLVGTTVELSLDELFSNDNVRVLKMEDKATEETTVYTTGGLILTINSEYDIADFESYTMDELVYASQRNLQKLYEEIDSNNEFVSRLHKDLVELGLEVEAFKYVVSKHISKVDGKNLYGLIVRNSDYRNKIELIITKFEMTLIVGESAVKVHNGRKDIEVEDLYKYFKLWFNVSSKHVDRLFLL